MMGYFKIFLPLLLFAFGCSNPNGADFSDKPNILFIAVDDLNDWVGPLGGKEGIQTPNIDELANSSLVFTNAHTASPACHPSRVAIMTGVHPARTGIMNNEWYDGPKWKSNEKLKNIETLEQFFKNRGYKTLGAGKIYHSIVPPRVTLSQIEPENWDFYYPSPHITMPLQIRAPEDEIYPADIIGERPHPYFTWGAIPSKDEKMSDYQVVDWASYELSQNHEKPFFMATGIFRPHEAWEVPQKYFDMYPLDEITLPQTKKDDLVDAVDHGRRGWHKFVLQNDQWKHVVQAYMASITFADAQIGRLLDALKESPHAENTIVVLWSDHGLHLGEKENWQKFTLWEQSTRVPLIFKVPGITDSGTMSAQPVSLLDIYPTLADVTGFDIPSHLDGTSLLPQMKNPERKKDPIITSFNFTYGYRTRNKPFSFGNTQLIGEGHAVRSQHYRYIYYPKIGLEELYDHRSDPNEYTNIAYEENEEVIKRHRQKLLELLPDLRWDNEIPLGYELKEGRIKNIEYKPMPDF